MKDRVMDMRKISLNMNMSDFEKTAVMATLSTLSIVIRDRGRDFDAWMVEKKMAADAKVLAETAKKTADKALAKANSS